MPAFASQQGHIDTCPAGNAVKVVNMMVQSSDRQGEWRPPEPTHLPSSEQRDASPKQASPQAKHTTSAQTQPDQLGSYGLPLHQAAASRPMHRFDDATDLASPLPGSPVAASAQTGAAQPQFMSGLMGLHGVTTPEEKQRREDKQKQYARELDEQVSLPPARLLVPYKPSIFEHTCARCWKVFCNAPCEIKA